MLSRFLSNRSDLSRSDDPFGHLQREIGRVVEDAFRGMPALRAGFGMGFAPSLDVKETPQGVELTAELPGVKEDDVELSLEGDLLTLSGEKREERRSDDKGMHMQERSFGRFQRVLRLPFVPDQGSVAARFEHGVLHVTLPRPSQAAERSNRIPIRGGAMGGQSGAAAATGGGESSQGTGTGGPAE
ncbi:MAG: Hsp20/alpha crystallin family protein, partial [Acetobacteraceae bacterium]|nr:Hsp20/alpha crystallin family protein [Acetobacteraceae bacterium]